MKAFRNSMLTIAALALVGIFAGTANAQSRVGGNFTLPFDARWGNTVLPAGDYTFTIKPASSAVDSVYLVTFAQEGKFVGTINSRKDLAETGARNMLVAVRSGGKYRIRTMHLAVANLNLKFPVPKAEQTLIAVAPALIQSVPILVAAN